jgi:hypothetical protein
VLIGREILGPGVVGTGGSRQPDGQSRTQADNPLMPFRKLHAQSPFGAAISVTGVRLADPGLFCSAQPTSQHFVPKYDRHT